MAVIGYPWRQSRTSPEVEEVLRRVFGVVYNVKRLAPGQVIASDSDSLSHDCSTLSGNSGSAVVDLETGRLVGLHKEGGSSQNYAVPVSVVADRLQAVG